MDVLSELEAEFRKGGITLGHLVAEGEHLDGICEGKRVVVDPAPATVDTLIHEVLHRRFPRWGERRVSKTAERIVRQMDHATVRKWYRRLMKTAKKAKRPIHAD